MEKEESAGANSTSESPPFKALLINLRGFNNKSSTTRNSFQRPPPGALTFITWVDLSFRGKRERRKKMALRKGGRDDATLLKVFSSPHKKHHQSSLLLILRRLLLGAPPISLFIV